MKNKKKIIRKITGDCVMSLEESFTAIEYDDGSFSLKVSNGDNYNSLGEFEKKYKYTSLNHVWDS